MFRTVITAAVAVSFAISPATAQSQAARWQVVIAAPGVAMLATMPTGSSNAKKLQAMAVLDAPGEAGVDRAVTDWVVDCDAQTVNNIAGVGLLAGVVQPNVWSSATGGVPITPKPGSIHGMILDYACTGTRQSADATVLTSEADAAAYGRKLAGQ